MPETWTPLLISLVALGVFLYGASKTTMPVLGVVAGPLLAATLGATTASAFAVPLLIVGDFFALALYRQHANWRLILRMIPGVLIGFVLTALMFRFLDPHLIARIIGALILISLSLELWQRHRNKVSAPTEQADPHTNRAAVVFFGALAGMTTMAVNAGGTALTLYLVKMRVPMLAFMGTSAWFFFVVNVAKIPVMVGLGLLTWQTLSADLWFVPLIAVGALLGVLVFRRMNQQVFNNTALALSGVAGLWLLVHG